MRKRISTILVLAIISTLAFIPNATANVPAWFVEEMVNNEALLESGTTTYCNKNFMVENMDNELAEVHVIFGNGANYTVNQIEPKGKRTYSLTADYGFSGGWESSRNTRIDDARIINSTGGTSKIKVHC